MEKENQNSNSHFSFAFIFGIVIGGLIVFFLGTKKGRKLIEEILSEGADICGEYLQEDPQLEEKAEKETAKAVVKLSNVQKAAETAKRFFRRSGKTLL